jgi:hypothetical protein
LESAALILDKIAVGIAASGKFKRHPYTPIRSLSGGKRT